MANDRMYLKCQGCGEQLLLAKSFGRGWVLWGINNPRINPEADVPSMTYSLPQSGCTVIQPQFDVADRLQKWLTEHEDCAPANDAGACDHFKIIYEVKDNA